MAKAPKRAFVCNECGADYPRWQGQCSACHAWNTITEVRGVAASPSVARNERLSGYAGNAGVSKVQKLSDISLEALRSMDRESLQHYIATRMIPHVVAEVEKAAGGRA